MGVKNNAIFAYVPVIHAGYLEFFEKYLESGDELFLLNGKEIAKRDNILEIEHLNRDLRAIDTDLVFEWLKLYFARKKPSVHVGISILSSIESIKSNAGNFKKVVMPDDDVTEVILSRIPHLRDQVTLESMFLRWDTKASLLEKDVKVSAISSSELPSNVVIELKKQIENSIDWWRQVACVIYNNDGHVLFSSYNRHIPSDLTLNVLGDPRSNFNPGEHIENCTAIHAEQWAIAQQNKVFHSKA